MKHPKAQVSLLKDDPQFDCILNELRDQEVQTCGLLLELYRWKNDGIAALDIQLETLTASNRILRGRIDQWIEKSSKACKEATDWSGFQTPFETAHGQVQFMMKLRRMQFDEGQRRRPSPESMLS